jgi:hypothetical protein
MVDAVLFFAYAGCFTTGSWLIKNCYIAGSDWDYIFKSMMGVIFAAICLGQNSAFMANYAEAIIAGRRMLELFKTEPLIDIFGEGIY